MNEKIVTTISEDIVTSIITTATEQLTEVTEIETMESLQEKVSRTAGIIERSLTYFKSAIPTIIIALSVLVVGILLSKLTTRLISKALKKSNLEGAARSFLVSLIKIILYIIAIIMALTMLNVPMSSIITIFGAIGLAISLALQNCLSNLAGGFIILFSKPFVAGDTIEIDGSIGSVRTISILYTKIETFDGKSVLIPNGKVSEAKITNYTETPTRRIELQFNIAYSSDYDRAREIILSIIKDEKMALLAPDPIVRMASHNESSVLIDVFVWVANENYRDTKYNIIESVKSNFDKNGIEIPFNQLDLHIKEFANNDK